MQSSVSLSLAAHCELVDTRISEFSKITFTLSYIQIHNMQIIGMGMICTLGEVGGGGGIQFHMQIMCSAIT